MESLLPLAEKIAARLIERKETVAVAEGSAGGLISAALLAVPGASAYFVGGAVVYTGAARDAFAGISLDDMKPPGMCASSSAPPGRWPRLAPRGHPAIAMATRPATPASRSQVPPRAPRRFA